jgi:predicted transcriptional regulator
MSASEFTDFMYNKLYSEKYLKDPKFDKLRKIWKDVKEYSYSKENEFIGKLVKNNEDNFKELEEILESEIKHNQDLRKEIEKMFN